MKRLLDNPEFEPAERNPKAIRNTVIILVFMMLTGGFLIVGKYKEKMAEELEETKKGRPAMSLGNVDKNFQVRALDGQVYDFGILAGKVSLMAVVSVDKPEQSQLIIDEMKRVAGRFPDHRMQFICISAEPESKVSLKTLREFAKQVGIPDEGGKWYVFAAEHDGFSGFIKDILTLGMVSKVDKVTQQSTLPDLLRIIDTSMKIRGEINDFSFLYYHEVEERTKREIAANPSLLEDERVKEILPMHQNAVQYHRDRMDKNIQYLLENEEYDQNFAQKNNSNRYSVPLMVFSGFVLFIVFMGWRQMKKSGRAL